MSYLQWRGHPVSSQQGSTAAVQLRAETMLMRIERPGVESASEVQTTEKEHCATCSAEHVAQFYESDDFLLNQVEAFVGPALRDGGAGIVIATATHRQGVEDRLRAGGIDLATARANGTYVSLDAQETLTQIMTGGDPDAARLKASVDDLIARAGRGGRPVYAFGEMVALLMADGNARGAMTLDQLWNDLQRRSPFSLLCAYPAHLFGREGTEATLEAVCATHSRVVPDESYSALDSANDRQRAVVQLQHRARQLERELANRKRIEEQLRNSLAAEEVARQQAEVAQSQRDEFLSIASHELRNPLTGLTLNAQLALRQLERNGRLEPERMERALEAITSQAAKMSRLLDQLLDVSRLAGGKLPLQPQMTDLVALVTQVVSSARVRTGRHEIHLEAPRALHAWVDALRVEQVLVNLLDNAIKFSPDGGVIDVTLTRAEPFLAEFAVRDHGLGIPPDARGGMFKRFFQAHNDNVHQGLGLGLYVSRQIVELHGGEIRAEFPADGGTRIVSRFPTAEPGEIAQTGPHSVDELDGGARTQGRAQG